MDQTKICNISLPQVVDFYQHSEAFAIFLVLILTTSSILSQEKMRKSLNGETQIKKLFILFILDPTNV